MLKTLDITSSFLVSSVMLQSFVVEVSISLAGKSLAFWMVCYDFILVGVMQCLIF